MSNNQTPIKGMIRVKFDSEVAMSQGSETNEAKPFLRGLVVAGKADTKLAELAGDRIQVWSDVDPKAMKLKGKIVDVNCEFTRRLQPEGNATFDIWVAKDLAVVQEIVGDEADAIRDTVAEAQVTNLLNKEAKKFGGVRAAAASGETQKAPEPAAAAADDI